MRPVGVHADISKRMLSAYDTWWDDVLPHLENENAYKSAPKANSLKELYWRQYTGPAPNHVPPGTEVSAN